MLAPKNGTTESAGTATLAPAMRAVKAARPWVAASGLLMSGIGW
ncbi:MULTISPECIES: hypothetical protein [Hafniaceae]|nr:MULTISPECIES: hypothetical protein [Hafniaceae]